MTPRETMQVMEAIAWREEQKSKRDLALAWHTAALMRRKKLPGLKNFLTASEPARPLKGEELERRREEFSRMSKAANLDKVIKKVSGGNPTG